MGTKEKATEAANPQHSGSKDNKNICIRATIKALFLSGKKFTARKINQLTRSNDARKQISELRHKYRRNDECSFSPIGKRRIARTAA